MTRREFVYRPAREGSISTAVVQGIADAKGVDPTELDECLYETLDPCALDRLFDVNGDASASRNGRVEFVMAGCRVCVNGTREVVVSFPEKSPTEDKIRA